MENSKIKDVVEEVLKEDPKTRDSDLWLIIQVLRKMGIKIYIDYDQIDSIPSFESITRARRLIQNNEGRFVPSPEVDMARNKKQEECRELYRGSQYSGDY